MSHFRSTRVPRSPDHDGKRWRRSGKRRGGDGWEDRKKENEVVRFPSK